MRGELWVHTKGNVLRHTVDSGSCRVGNTYRSFPALSALMSVGEGGARNSQMGQSNATEKRACTRAMMMRLGIAQNLQIERER